MKTKADEKVIQYLNEARGTELALTRTLQAHIAVTPTGRYRAALERHLRETRDHAKRVEHRLDDLGAGKSLVDFGVGVFQSVLGQVLSLSKGPIDLVRGESPEERLLKNAKDECATEALEIATYDALEHFAQAVGDERTAELAQRIRADEERALEQLRGLISDLTDAVIAAELEGESHYDVSKTGAADAAREAKGEARGAARDVAGRARGIARQARKVPGVARAEGEAKGAVASAEDLPISDYDEHNAQEIVQRLGGLSQIDLAKVDAYERKTQSRKTVLDRISAIQGREPWPGYDEQTVADIRKAMSAADDERVRGVVAYERGHKNRQGVLDAAEHATNSS